MDDEAVAADDEGGIFLEVGMECCRCGECPYAR